MPAKKEISLLPDKENANSLVNRLIKWTTTVGRAIIIVTELIVVGAFLSRFWLDRMNSDLSEVIRQQKAILESTQDFEKEYNLLQQRLKALAGYSGDKKQLDQQLLNLASSVPDDVSLDGLRLDAQKPETDINLTAVAYKEESIVDFITNLSINPQIKIVNVKKIEKKTKDNKYYIDLGVTFKTQTTKT